MIVELIYLNNEKNLTMLGTLIQASSTFYTLTFNTSIMNCKSITLKHNMVDMKKKYKVLDINMIDSRHVLFKTLHDNTEYIINVEYMNNKLYVNINSVTNSYMNYRYVFNVLQTDPYYSVHENISLYNIC